MQILKIILAVICVAAVVAVAGADLYPEIPSYEVLTYAAGTALLALALAVLLMLLGHKLNLFSLNRGGTDTQWLWFDADPPGLQRERERSAAGSISQRVAGEIRRIDQDGDR